MDEMRRAASDMGLCYTYGNDDSREFYIFGKFSEHINSVLSNML